MEKELFEMSKIALPILFGVISITAAVSVSQMKEDRDFIEQTGLCPVCEEMLKIGQVDGKGLEWRCGCGYRIKV